MDGLDSALGTREHWEDTFKSELQSYLDDGTDGEIWFGPACVKRLLTYLRDYDNKSAASVIDLGCGNGHILRKLRTAGFTGNLVGIDYAQSAVQAAAAMSSKDSTLTYLQGDLTNLSSLSPDLVGQFDLAIDKGTLDAISLAPDAENAVNGYKQSVRRLLGDRGKWVVCSCNYTADEMRQEISDNSGFRFLEELPPLATYNFGGKTGTTNVICVFDVLPQ